MTSRSCRDHALLPHLLLACISLDRCDEEPLRIVDTIDVDLDDWLVERLRVQAERLSVDVETMILALVMQECWRVLGREGWLGLEAEAA